MLPPIFNHELLSEEITKKRVLAQRLKERVLVHIVELCQGEEAMTLPELLLKDCKEVMSAPECEGFRQTDGFYRDSGYYSGGVVDLLDLVMNVAFEAQHGTNKRIREALAGYYAETCATWPLVALPPRAQEDAAFAYIAVIGTPLQAPIDRAFEIHESVQPAFKAYRRQTCEQAEQFFAQWRWEHIESQRATKQMPDDIRHIKESVEALLAAKREAEPPPRDVAAGGASVMDAGPAAVGGRDSSRMAGRPAAEAPAITHYVFRRVEEFHWQIGPMADLGNVVLRTDATGVEDGFWLLAVILHESNRTDGLRKSYFEWSQLLNLLEKVGHCLGKQRRTREYLFQCLDKALEHQMPPDETGRRPNWKTGCLAAWKKRRYARVLTVPDMTNEHWSVELSERKQQDA